MTVRELIDMLIKENHDAQVIIDECGEHFETIESTIHEVYTTTDDGFVRLVKGDRIKEEGNEY